MYNYLTFGLGAIAVIIYHAAFNDQPILYVVAGLANLFLIQVILHSRLFIIVNGGYVRWIEGQLKMENAGWEEYLKRWYSRQSKISYMVSYVFEIVIFGLTSVAIVFGYLHFIKTHPSANCLHDVAAGICMAESVIGLFLIWRNWIAFRKQMEDKVESYMAANFWGKGENKTREA